MGQQGGAQEEMDTTVALTRNEVKELIVIPDVIIVLWVVFNASIFKTDMMKYL